MIRTVVALVIAIVFGALLASCSPLEGDGRHMVPLSGAMKTRLAAIGASPQSSMMVRIFKEEDTLEVWSQTRDGSYKLVKSYDICAWSGELGPKFQEGDRQAPEGFYTITPGLMNPRSNYYLAFNLGFPNKFDRAHSRTGSHLMVHGACSSAGCFAMEDDQIAEIYALARESFAGGNRTFEVQIFPFRMTAQNLARHQSSPHFDFWKNLKEGHDYFDVANHPPAWDVCNNRYVFRQPTAANAASSMAGACPAVQADPSIVSAFMTKQAQDAETLHLEVARLADAETSQLKAAERRAAAEAEAAERGEVLSDFFSSLWPWGTEPEPEPDA